MRKQSKLERKQTVKDSAPRNKRKCRIYVRVCDSQARKIERKLLRTRVHVAEAQQFLLQASDRKTVKSYRKQFRVFLEWNLFRHERALDHSNVMPGLCLPRLLVQSLHTPSALTSLLWSLMVSFGFSHLPMSANYAATEFHVRLPLRCSSINTIETVVALEPFGFIRER